MCVEESGVGEQGGWLLTVLNEGGVVFYELVCTYDDVMI